MGWVGWGGGTGKRTDYASTRTCSPRQSTPLAVCTWETQAVHMRALTYGATLRRSCLRARATMHFVSAL